MLLMNPIKDAGRAAEYFGQSDGGYYLDGNELKREWGGKAAAMLGLTGRPEYEQLHRLLNGLHPMTGKQLTARLVDDRTPGTDFTARLPKNVTAFIEGGDERIMPLVYRVANESMQDIEQYAMTRMRKGGQEADRVTGNLLWLMVEHPEARPAKEDGMSDYDRHLHCIVPNLTWDDAEKRWKALKVEEIFTLRKYFSHRFDLALSAGLADLGYELETELQPGKDGGMEYHTWDIKAAPGHEKELASGKAKMSRRHQEIEEKEKGIVAARKARDAEAPDTLSAVAQYKLSATTRQGKVKEMTLDDLRAYWDSRLADGEKAAITATIERAKRGGNPAPKPLAAQAMDHAVRHCFQRSSVVEYRDLLVAAMEKSMGAATTDDLDREARRQGVLFDGGKVAPRGEVSTQAVLDQERRIVAFARAGRGTCKALAPGKTAGLDGLSAEQAAAVRHVWNSRDRVMLIRGAPGAGKTRMMTPALDRLGAPAVLLAPSSDASRLQLRKEGFKDANTVAAFLGDRRMQEQARGGLIWIDEASLLAVNDLDTLCGLARSLDARLVLQGDPAQHRAVDRDGNMLRVLETHAGLRVAELTEIKRQKGDYAKAVAAIRGGKLEDADALLRNLGWVVEGQGHDALVAEFARAIEETKPGGECKSVLVVDPTHKDGDALTERLRAVLKDRGVIHGQERAFARLKPLHWTDAQKADARRYAGDEVIQFFRNSGRFKAGDRVKAGELLAQLAAVAPKAFAVFAEAEATFAVGDTIRITSNGRDVTGKHRVDNGRIDRIAGFTRGGDIRLANGWVLGKDFAHVKHGLVSTSPASQSKTEDIVLGAFNRASLGAMSLAQFLVTVSRGRERGMIFTDLSRDELLSAIGREDRRKSAIELFQPETQAPVTERADAAMRRFRERIQQVWRQWRGRAEAAKARHQELSYAR